MNVTNAIEGGFHIISVEGEVDASSSLHLDDALQKSIENNGKKIIIDCSKLSYISSSGIGVFTSRIEECEENKIGLALFGMAEHVYNVFKILGLHQVLPIVSSKTEAKQLVDEVHQRNNLS